MEKENKKILIISPAFPPIVNGLGDYSAILGRELEKKDNITISYAGLPQSQIPSVTPYHEINSRNTIKQIIKDNEVQTIFINYANYGYQKKGIPFWLLRELKKLKDKRIHIFFHELNATSHKPWQLVFWLKPLQVYIYKRLIKIAETIYCSNEIVNNILNKNSSGKLIKTGIFANISEPSAPLKLLLKRDDTAVVFGSYARRKLVYQNFKSLNKFILTHHIKNIIDIGNGNVTDLAQNIDVPVIAKGILPNEEIENLLKDAKYGFISYPSAMFGKSGIFAAYAAYGLVIYNLDGSKHNNEENLIELIHYIPRNYQNHSDINYISISEKVELWYKERNLSEHIHHIYQSIKQK